MIVERPIRDKLRVETLTRTASPFVIGEGILGYSKLADAGTPQTWHDWTGDLSAARILRGGRLEGVTVRNSPGMFTLTIHDVEIDLANPQLYREQPIRVHHIDHEQIYTNWIEQRRNRVATPRPTVYSGSGWAASSVNAVGENPGWVGGSISGVTTFYVFTKGSDRAYAAGEQVTLSVRYKVAATAPGSALHVCVMPHLRSGNKYFRDGYQVTRPIVVGQEEFVTIQWVTPEAIAAGNLDIAVVTSAASGLGFSPAQPGFDMRATEALIEDEWTSGRFFDGNTNPFGELERTRWTGAANASPSVIETRTVTDGDEILSPLFTGWVRDVEQHYGGPRPGTSIPRTFVTITAVDAVARHDETTRYGVIPPEAGETLAERVTRLRASAPAPVEIPTDDYLDGTGNPVRLGRTVYESSLSNHFTLAANTVGAMWFVDAAGVTRFVPRVYDPATAVEFTTTDTSGGALSAVAYVPAAATDTGFNTITAHNKAAIIDPGSGDWVDLETEHDLIPGFISLLGKQYALLDTNAADVSQLGWAIAWVQPNMFGWGSLLGSIRWNAQQDIRRVPDLDLGASITAEAFTVTADPWSQYLVVGVEHEITPTRWITNLTLIGAQA